MNTAQLLPALLRTVVPLLYGLLIQAGLGKVFSGETITTIATIIVTGILYLLLRLLERLQPWIGVLLGWAKQPQYADVVAGQVLEAKGQAAAATKDDLAQLRDDVIADLAPKLADFAAQAQTTAAAGASTASTTKLAQLEQRVNELLAEVTKVGDAIAAGRKSSSCAASASRTKAATGTATNAAATKGKKA